MALEDNGQADFNLHHVSGGASSYKLCLFLEHCVPVVPWAGEAQGVVCIDVAAVVQVHSLLTKSSHPQDSAGIKQNEKDWSKLGAVLAQFLHSALSHINKAIQGDTAALFMSVI